MLALVVVVVMLVVLELEEVMLTKVQNSPQQEHKSKHQDLQDFLPQEDQDLHKSKLSLNLPQQQDCQDLLPDWFLIIALQECQ
jgi:hypothetical protein